MTIEFGDQREYRGRLAGWGIAISKMRNGSKLKRLPRQVDSGEAIVARGHRPRRQMDHHRHCNHFISIAASLTESIALHHHSWRLGIIQIV